MPTARVGVITQSKGPHLAEYFAALRDIEAVEKVAIADDSGENFAAAKESLPGKLSGAYRSADDMLRELRPQLVLVSMEPARAPREIDRALDAGCYIATEKPACLRTEDFAKLVRKAESKHLEMMLTLANRTHAPVKEARSIVRRGLLGRLYGLSMHLVADQARLKRPDYRNSWRCEKQRAGGGHLAWLGIHWLDMATFITGLQVEQVSGMIHNVGGEPMDVEDSATVSLRYTGGVLGSLLSGFYLDKTFKEQVQRYDSHLQIWGEEGWLRLATFEERPLEWYSTRQPGPPKVQSFEYPTGMRSYTPFMEAAVRASLGLAEPPITAAEGLQVLQTIFAAYDSAETGKRIALTGNP